MKKRWYISVSFEFNPACWRLSWWEHPRAAEGQIEFGPLSLSWYFS